MNKLLSLFLVSLLLTACSSETPIEEPVDELPVIEPVETLTNEDWTDCSLAETKLAIEGITEKMLPQQITACRKLGDLSFAFITQPNSWIALQDVRDWEAEGHSALSGLLYKEEGSEWEVFFEIPEEDFNPVNLFLRGEDLVLDIADDSGAGSGEGKLLRYTYTFSAVQDHAGTWVKEKCDEYYVPETYSADKTCL